MNIENDEYWTHISHFIKNDDTLTPKLLKQIETLVGARTIKIVGKEIPTPRLSCVLWNKDKVKELDNSKNPHKSYTTPLFSYDSLPSHDWKESSIIMRIKECVERRMSESPLREMIFKDGNSKTFDYCLVHLYRDNKDSIAWHNDKEALNSEVVSISLGESRKFKIKSLRLSKGDEGYRSETFLLKSGDLFIMKKGCQSLYTHCVPKESKECSYRINLTFRRRE